MTIIVTGTQRLAVAQRAEVIGFEHRPYVFGGAGPQVYDCSGLALVAWAVAGVSLPHNTIQQSIDKQVTLVGSTASTRAKLLPGDLVFYRTDPANPQQLSHVAVFLREFGGMELVAQATDTELGSEVIRMRKYGNEAMLGLVGHN